MSDPKSDILTVVYDDNGIDEPCLVVARIDGDKKTILNVVFGQFAVGTYRMLTNYKPAVYARGNGKSSRSVKQIERLLDVMENTGKKVDNHG